MGRLGDGVRRRRPGVTQPGDGAAKLGGAEEQTIRTQGTGRPGRSNTMPLHSQPSPSDPSADKSSWNNELPFVLAFPRRQSMEDSPAQTEAKPIDEAGDVAD